MCVRHTVTGSRVSQPGILATRQFFRSTASGDDLMDRRSTVEVNPFPARHLQLQRIQSQLVQHRGVNVGDVVPVLDRIEPEFVGRPWYTPLIPPGPQQVNPCG
ncbi:MAG: hypothetical protein Ct9H300mP1_33040 [Planctomycetaceae bacterium]|nr:MAG: hypothetical protein Ct9H300mP1_33040 [Planctomycetaceae bacterium]